LNWNVASLFIAILVVAAATTANHATTHAFQTTLRTHSQIKWTTSHPSLSVSLPSSPTRLNIAAEKISLKDYLQGEIDRDTIDAGLLDVVVALAKSCAEVSMRLQTLSLGLQYHHDAGGDTTVVGTDVAAAVVEIETKINVQGEQQKGMDVVANDIFITNLRSVDAVLAMASEEEDSVILNHHHKNKNSSSASNTDGTVAGGGCYEIAFDPLDGSGNLDANLPTGSIFGIAPSQSNGETAFFSRQGSALRAAGYALYSSSTELVVCLGKDHPGGVLGFTLDPTNYHRHGTNDPSPAARTAEDAFVLSRTNISCPPSGPYYSLNEAREPDWPDGLKRWVSDAKRKTNQQPPYSARYVCSLCADFHRTLLQGGWAGNPRPHLRLLYEAAPLAFVVEAAGGRGSDGVRDLLEIVPRGLHDRVPVFLGSRQEISDLVETYGDVQQVEAKRYEA